VAQFADFQLPEAIHKALLKLSFSTPTPIQEKSIPVALDGRDLIACAQTGSGKTAAYGIPLVTKLLADTEATALILAPTRELAKQISEVIYQLTNFAQNLNMVLIVGGSDMQKQIRSLQRKPRIIIATPGRLTDHLRRQNINLKNTKFLVLDEGDRMLDMGFAPQLDVILKYLTGARQTLLYSATLPPKVKELAQKYLKHPLHISVGEDSIPVSTIKQSSVQTTQAGKNELLLNELNARKGSAIVFTKTQVRTDKVAKYLESYGFSVARIHGGRSQGQRNSALQGFRDGKFRVLVATDIAARGIDVPHIQHVINYDLPMMDDDYVHRIGRTARAGATGEALSFLTPEDTRYWFLLARKYKIPGVDFSRAPQGRGGRAGHSAPPVGGRHGGRNMFSTRSERDERSRGYAGGGAGGGRSGGPKRDHKRPQAPGDNARTGAPRADFRADQKSTRREDNRPSIRDQYRSANRGEKPKQNIFHNGGKSQHSANRLANTSTRD
jgi:ATP-dependent RNA helicase DeaD